MIGATRTAVVILDHLAPHRILLDGRASGKHDVLADIGRLLADGAGPSAETILEGLLDREQVMSTGIGRGIAIPHARLDVPDTRVALARYPAGVDFKALDHQPVYLAFGVIGPPSGADQHVKMLARIARLVKTDASVAELLKATSVDAVLDALRRHEG
jgi:PTS system nitrogen regulatory IIA component